MKKIGLKILLASLLITSLAVFLDLISGSLRAGNHYLWTWAANVLVTLVLFPFIWNNRLRGGALVLTTFGVYYIIGIFSIMIEAFIFNVTDRSFTLRGMLWGIPMFFAASWIFVKIIGSQGEGQSIHPERRSVGSWIVKVLSGNVLYLLFYFIAGITLQMSYPGFTDYYGDKVPPLGTIVGTQLLIRGFLFVGVAVVIDYYCTLAAWQKAVLIGVIFSVLGGIAPLLTPNELMPQGIRIAHGFEVGISNFLYGIVLHRIIRRKPIGQTQSTAERAFQSNAVAS